MMGIHLALNFAATESSLGFNKMRMIIIGKQML
jgi:hypothetical protein